jgi:putative molybdopterin biosynthesis protein
VAEHTVYPAGGILGALLDQLIVLQGSDDWLLSHVVERFASRSGIAVATASVGSLAGLSALAAGTTHLASCHVDPSAVRNMAKAPVYLFGLYAREQGILFDGGRRAGVAGLAAICRDGVRFAARQPQSGTSRLVERMLSEQGLEARWTSLGPFSSHLEVALDVRNGHADAGVGIRVAARLAGLDFTPIAREPFYLVIPASLMSHRRVSEFLEFIVDELKAEARREHPGYSFEALGRVQPLVPEA